MVAWFGDLVAARRLAFAFDIGAVHEFLEDDEHGVAADTASICSRQRWFMTSEGDSGPAVNLPRERILSGGPLVVSLRRKFTGSMATAVVEGAAIEIAFFCFALQRQLTRGGAQRPYAPKSRIGLAPDRDQKLGAEA